MKTMIDSDTGFNTSSDISWCSEQEQQGEGCSLIEYYVEQTVTHEMGHLLGLDHSANTTAVMYASTAFHEDKTLTSDDLARRNILYYCQFTYGACTPGGHGGECRPFCYE